MLSPPSFGLLLLYYLRKITSRISGQYLCWWNSPPGMVPSLEQCTRTYYIKRLGIFGGLPGCHGVWATEVEASFSSCGWGMSVHIHGGGNCWGERKEASGAAAPAVQGLRTLEVLWCHPNTHSSHQLLPTRWELSSEKHNQKALVLQVEKGK